MRFKPKAGEARSNEKYVDREGVERTSTILVASSFEFVQTAKREDGRMNEAGANGARANQGEESDAVDSETDEDIPF